LSSHITYCCFMLCNFRTCIVPKDAWMNESWFVVYSKIYTYENKV
jgi:hypothetical protein